MFTGIIRHLGTIAKWTPEKGGAFMTVSCKGAFGKAKAGDSIAINGTCLTVLKKSKDQVVFELGPETLRKTSFVDAKEGDLINIEFPLRVGDALDGHFVQGHVDGVATISSIKKDGQTIWLGIALSPDQLKQVIYKGSIAIDGVSLTVAEKEPKGVSIMLLPYTVEETRFKQNKPGDKVNVEFDMLGKYVTSLLK